MPARSILLGTISICVFGARAANAACVISDVRPAARVLLPAWTLPTRAVGQEFYFVATDDCVRLRFVVPATTFFKIPEPVPFTSNQYRVHLTERAWNSLLDESDTTFTWTIIGETRAGVITGVTTTNEVKVEGGVTIDLSMADAKLVGEESDDWAGDSVSRAGDVDGDGHDDLLVGARENDEGGDDAGAAYLVLGPVTGALDLSRAHAKLVGEAAEDIAGDSVSGAGDVNDDGHDDLLIGAYFNDDAGSNAGAAYLILGPVTGTVDLSRADAKFVGEEASDIAGSVSENAVCDVNGDGHDDLLVGAGRNDEGGTDAGAAYLVLGPVTGTLDLALADAKLVGEDASDLAGVFAGAGDVDGDGHDDLLVGAHNNDEGGTDAGAAYLVLGPVTGTLDLSLADAKLVGEPRTDSADGAGRGAGAGDVDGDGHDDVLVGAPGNDEGGKDAGAAYLVLGSVTGTLDLSLADAKLLGERNSDGAGRSVSSAGDVDGDGRDDVLVGSNNDEGGTSAGAAYLVLGPVTGTLDLHLADAKLVGERDDGAGVVSGVGDVDADGRADILVGALGNDEGGSDAGAAYLLYGGGL